MSRRVWWLAPILAGLLAAGCSGGGELAVTSLDALTPAAGQDPLRLVASTTLVADVVQQVAGPDAQVTALLPPMADPHSFILTAQHLTAVQAADLVVTNGLGLEEALLADLLAAAVAPVISISEGIEPRELGEAEQADENEAEGEEQEAELEDEGEAADGDDHHGVDPHVWMDPTLVQHWADNMGRALAALDPSGAAEYERRAAAYQLSLAELDAWIVQQVAGIAPEDRLLVTDHEALGYFADRYRFEVVGAVVPGFSTLAEPSAGQLAELQQELQDRGVKAIFISVSANRALAERLSEDLGLPLVPLFTGGLSQPQGEAPNYLAMMEHDVMAIVQALR